MITPTQWFQGTVWILALIGLVFRYSVTGQMAADPGMALLKELAYFAAALGGFHLCGRISRENLQRWGRPMVLAAIGVLVLMVLGLSARANGASRWIDLGFMRFQPGELIKVVLVIYMADYLTRHGREVGEWKRGFLPAVGVMGTLFLLVVMQPDFGTALILFTIGAWMMLMAGSKLKHFSVLALAGLPALVLLILSAPYRLQRVMAWFNPHEDLRGSAYQVNQAKWAIAQGGLLGRGLLGGDARLGYLPECENDFIAAVWIEESGFLGFMLLTLLFAFLVAILLHICARPNDIHAKLLSGGVSAMIGSQVLINLFVITGLLPNKGLPLPFFSSGGTSLVATACMLGLVWKISRESSTSGVPALRTAEITWNGL